jgi:hypothetical protein
MASVSSSYDLRFRGSEEWAVQVCTKGSIRLNLCDFPSQGNDGDMELSIFRVFYIRRF